MLKESKLANELNALEPTSEVLVGIDRFCNAFTNYFALSTVKGVEADIDRLAPCKSAMRSSLSTAVSLDFNALTTAITAFWTALSSVAVGVWVVLPPLASVTPPPNLSKIAVDLQVSGTVNIMDALEKDDAMKNIAAAIHPNNLGGFAVDTTTPTPVSTPIL
jgi:hypothetical protein